MAIFFIELFSNLNVDLLVNHSSFGELRLEGLKDYPRYHAVW